MKRPSVALLAFAVILDTAAFGQYRSSIVAGGGPPDGVSAMSVALSSVHGVAVDSAGNVYASSGAQNRVYKIALNGTITTAAGNGTTGYSGDSGPASGAQLNAPAGIAVDSAGNLYIADSGNARIRKVSGGIITTVAGNGSYGYSGDNGLAVGAQIGYVTGIAVDNAGNLYIADNSNSRIRKVSGGLITTIAGTGSNGYSGDNGLAVSAQIANATAVAVDTTGSNLYIADNGNSRIRKVSGGLITTVAGNGTYGYSGDGGAATSAQIVPSDGIAVDNSGNLYLMGNARIRKVSAGFITTVAGNGNGGYSGDGGLAANAQIGFGGSLAADSTGNLYIGDAGNYRVRKISSGVITLLGGNGTYRYSGDGAAATTAQVHPGGLAKDTLGNLYIADRLDYRVRKVSGSVITTAVGTGVPGYSGDGGPATSAQISDAGALALDTAGNLYIADNARIRKLSGGSIFTVAGTGTYGYSGDGGPATVAQVSPSGGLAIDNAGNVYMADLNNNRVRKISGGIISLVAGGGPSDGAAATSVSIRSQNVAVDSAGNLYIAASTQNRVYKVGANGTIAIVAGDGTSGYSGDNGAAITAQLNFPVGVAVDNAGNVYIADGGNSRVRKVAGGVITTVAGGGSGCAQQTNSAGDGCPATSVWINPVSLALDSSANLYIGDGGNARIRKISGGVITTVAGTGVPGYSGDTGPAISAQINYPSGIAVDNFGNLFIADSGNYRVRKVSGGIITTVAGTGVSGYSGDTGPATVAQLGYPAGVAVDSLGNLFIADNINTRVRKVSGGVITTVAGTGSPGYSGDTGPAIAAQLGYPTGVAADTLGNLFIADNSNNRVRKVSGGFISTIAGNGFYSYSGDGGQAINAQLGFPSGLAVDDSGNLYISDTQNNRVRVVSPSGTITTFAGGGSQGIRSGIPATDAGLSSPGSLAADSQRNVYITDQSNQLLRKVSGGMITTITTIAGSGSYPFPGDGGVAVDSTGLYISESRDGRVRLLAPVSISSISPSFAVAGTSGFTLTVNGANFGNADIVFWNGTGLTTTFVDSSRLTAPVAASQLLQAGSVCVQVFATNALTGCSSFTVQSQSRLVSSVAIGSSPNPSTFGQPVTLTATVSAPAATGSVTFYDGPLFLGTRTIAGGQAVLVTNLLASGPQSIRAYYSGDYAYAPSSSNVLPQVVNVAPQSGLAPAVNYGAASAPVSAAAGDFNSDGYLDLAVANSGGGNVSVFLGNGNGVFQSAVNYAAGIGNSPIAIASGDFNGDGKTDLAVANTGSNNVSILLGNGNGTFQAAVNYAAGAGPRSIAVGDFNNDGYADLVVANAAGNNVSILLGNGNGTFQAAVNYAVGSSPMSVASGDFNGDGRVDLAAANMNSNNVSILLGNGNGTFQPAVNYTAGSSPASLAVRDLNNDNLADLVVANAGNNTVSVLLGNGNGTFQPAANYPAGTGPWSVTAGDFNGDSKPDLAIANATGNNVSILLGNGNGTFQSPVNYGVGSSPESLVTGDFNRDGRHDLAVVNRAGNNVSVLLGIGPALAAFRSDFNGDTHEDVIWQDQVTGWAQVWYLGGSQGVTTIGAINLTASNTWRIVGVADFNGDGRPDVVWQDPVGGAAQIWILGGPGGNVVTNAIVLSTGNTWRIRAVADFNGDGHPDCIWQDQVSGWAQIWFMGGPQGTNLLDAVNLTASNTWRIAGAADFNRDGRIDVLWQDPASGATQIWYLGGAQGNVLIDAVTLTGPNTWRIAAVGDFNGDGYPDTVWQDQQTGLSQAWFLGGTKGASITGAASMSGANSWRIMGPR